MTRGDAYAPDFPKNSIWLNTQKSLSLADLKGHVVLLDFWTYCCLNCLHVLPDLKYLEEKYREKPFLVIGVHAAKFFNEENLENIQSAIERYEIDHPVVVDEGHTIWESYGVSAWPSFVLIDAAGRIRGSVSGEGRRLPLSLAIEGLLAEAEKEGISARKPLKIGRKRKPAINTLSFPGKLTLDSRGSRIFISDSGHHRILVCHFHSPWEVHIKEIAGSGKAGVQDGPFNRASFNHPQGVCLVEDFLYVCDTGNHLLRRVDLVTKEVETIKGRFISPWDLAYAEGYLYIALAGRHQIWSLRLADGLVEALAGSGLEGMVDGNLAVSQLAQPSGISLWGNRAYFVDSESSSLRFVDLKKGEVETVVGRGLFEFGFKDGPFTLALMQHPLGVFAAENEIFLADSYNHAVRKADLKSQTLSTLVCGQPGQKTCLVGDKDCQVISLWEPSDVHKVDNFVYIADTNNHLVRVLNLSDLSLRDLTIVTHSQR